MLHTAKAENIRLPEVDRLAANHFAQRLEIELTLAHRQRNARVPPQLGITVEVGVWQRLLEPADAERPHRLGQLKGTGRIHPLIGVDHHLDLRADGLADARRASRHRRPTRAIPP